MKNCPAKIRFSLKIILWIAIFSLNLLFVDFSYGRRIKAESLISSYISSIDKYEVVFDDGRGNFEYLLAETNLKHLRPQLFPNQCEWGKRLKGSVIAVRFVVDTIKALGIKGANEYFNQDSMTLLKNIVTFDDRHIQPVLSDITIRAREGNVWARSFIEKIGREFGRALASFINEFRDEAFVKNIVLVSGFSEHFGIGVRGKESPDLFLESMQRAVKETLIGVYSFDRHTAQQCAQGIRRSAMEDAQNRELYAFLPKEEGKLSVAVSVGGTKLAAGLLNNHYQLEYTERLIWDEVFGDNLSKDNIIESIYKYIVTMIEKSGGIDSVSYIGIAWPGYGHYEEGIVTTGNIPGLREFNLKEYIKKKLQNDFGKTVDVIIRHDGYCSVLAETSPIGTLPGVKDAVAVILGTGIGAGILKDGIDFNRYMPTHFPGNLYYHIIYTSGP